MMNSQKNHWLALFPEDVLKVMINKLVMFRVVTCDGDVMSPCIFPHDLRLNMETKIKCLEEVVLSWVERVAAGRHYVWHRTLHHATHAEEYSVGWQKFSVTTSSLTPGHSTLQIATSLMCGTRRVHVFIREHCSRVRLYFFLSVTHVLDGLCDRKQVVV